MRIHTHTWWGRWLDFLFWRQLPFLQQKIPVEVCGRVCCVSVWVGVLCEYRREWRQMEEHDKHINGEHQWRRSSLAHWSDQATIITGLAAGLSFHDISTQQNCCLETYQPNHTLNWAHNTFTHMHCNLLLLLTSPHAQCVYAPQCYHNV